MNLKSKALLAFLISLIASAAIAQVPVTYQGQLIESGTPFTGSVDMEFAFYSVSSGGTPTLIVPKPGVAVQEGLFQAELNMTSLDLSQAWYLEARVQGSALLPRQRIAAAPIALYALDGPAAGGSAYQNVIVVAKSGGDYESVADALAAISDSSESNRYLVRVAPGIYTEDSLVEIPGYVHLQGDGPATTIITANRGSAAANQTAATIYMLPNSYLSDLGVRNTGGGPLSFGIYVSGASRATIVDNVEVVVSGAGTGGARSGIHLNSAAPTIKNSSFKASGATGFGTAVNAGLSSVHTAGGGFPQALVLNSIFLGGANSSVQECNDNSGTGFGMQLNQATPDIRHSHICGGHRSIALLQNGHPRIQGSELRVSANSDAFLLEISASGSISIAHSALAYFAKFTGTGTGLRCVHNHAWGTWLPLSNGTTAATACN